MKPSSGTNKGGSTCFCADLIVVFDISFNILTSGNAVIAGDLPYISCDAFKYLGTTKGNSLKPDTDNSSPDSASKYTDSKGIFSLSCFVGSKSDLGYTACIISTS